MKTKEEKRSGGVEDKRTMEMLKARLGEENYIKQFSVRVAENLAKIKRVKEFYEKVGYTKNDEEYNIRN